MTKHLPVASDLRLAMERLLALGGVAAQSRIVHVQGATLHHLELGAGPPLVLLHGATGGAANWFRLLGPLAQQQRVFALDLPGFGFSPAINPREPLGVCVAQLIECWLDATEIRNCVVVATSFGGLVALRLAQHVPERVRALVLIDSVGLGRELPRALRLACLGPLAAAALRPSRPGIRWQLNRLMLADPGSLPRAERSALIEYLYQSAAATHRTLLGLGFSMFADLRGQREVLSDHELRQLRSRLLIVWGARDRFLPLRHAQRAADLVPGATLRIIPGAGHSPNWETPTAVLECLSPFLS
ncbi:MAG: alpha/beta fold hydrolase [Longimicrobiales bacterium]